MGWRENFSVVRQRWRDSLSEYASHCHREIIRDLSANEVGLVSVPIAWLVDGCAKALGSPLLAHEFLNADLSSRWLKEPKPNGRPRGETTREAATVALYFYEAWLKENRKCGASDYGHRQEMKYFSAQAVVEDFFAWRIGRRGVMGQQLDSRITDIESFVDVVHALMEKPKNRRSVALFADLAFPATGKGLVLKLPPKPPSKK